jgi:hypothetical protein
MGEKCILGCFDQGLNLGPMKNLKICTNASFAWHSKFNLYRWSRHTARGSKTFAVHVLMYVQ